MTYLVIAVFIGYSLVSFDYKRKLNYPFVMLLLLLFLIFVRPFNWGADALTYVDMYEQIVSGNKLEQEFTFIIISKIVYFLGDSVKLLFFIYGLCSLSFKLNTIKKYAYYPYITFLFYFSTWFILHDMYQIRVGTSIAFFYCSVYFLQKKKYLSYLLCACVATAFHTQAALLFFLILIPKKEIDIYSVAGLSFIVLFSYVLYFFKADIFKNSIVFLVKLKIPRMHQVMYYYDIATSGGINLGKINAFSPIVLVRLMLSSLLLFQYKRLNSVDLYPVLIRILVLSFALRMILYPIPVLGMRIYEFFTCVDIFLFPLFLLIIREKKIVLAIINMYCIFMLYIALRGTM
ncbi:EpsG family protein [uncultured Treponema sp.]|jgi:hypothetical protein|uniref:EpsG family protein n=1 Tax=uncultured Treponema sp. TaxID=162155 RepID=UPI0028E46D25|nr:EpsG family protein [uncultured Treponema sp.]